MKCEYCGKELDSPRKKKFCSKTCCTISAHIRYGTNRNFDPNPTKKICVVCGKEFETRRKATVTCSHECSIKREKSRPRKAPRYKHTWEEWSELRRKQKEVTEAQKKEEKRAYKEQHIVTRECVICGSAFSCMDYEQNKTCSPICSKKYKNSKHCKDKRIPKDRIYDNDINNHLLFKRDKGKCWICGGMCEWEDIENYNGKIRYGKKYPSVDHVIPVSLNGTHSWDNVRLAHLGCNIEKGDTLIGFQPLEKETAYRYKKKGSSKRTIQKTVEGEIVRVWESTAQIRRELNVNDKRIQDVCRGRGKSAFGYRWEYEGDG